MKVKGIVLSLLVAAALCLGPPFIMGQAAPQTPGSSDEAPAAVDKPRSQVINISGLWGTKYGTMRVVQNGDEVEGTLANTSNFCHFKNGTKLLDGVILDDSVAGKFLMCQADDECGPPVWAQTLLLVAEENMVLSGSAHSKEALCPLVGFSKSEAGQRWLNFKRIAADVEAIYRDVVLPGPPAPPGTYDPRAGIKASPRQLELRREGERLIAIGKYEAARKKFKEALREDPGNPNALVGIGVTYYARNDYDKALEYYKKALASDGNYGMAYYNMACVYALKKQTKMALRYLKHAAGAGFVEGDMDKDLDLKSLHRHPEYQKIKRGEF